ncbi:hypothetical protein BOW50_08620 [Solemya velum gill symbiont]|uniref:V-type ATPase 116kDa subunit family protein n=1 Tax=Solemya velum gill symbiont TaxID=2340 RepID=UPI000998E1F8|nr:V-type ATPase 116kDa subunit family protein [Solemya velum gill symbiont]OOZ77081.1 hypothetical protein BOW50_08620 [Solemya velum gill symbiont]
MSLRPKPARWFEVLVDRNEISNAAEALAHTGLVEIVARQDSKEQVGAPELQEKLQEFTRLSQRYSHYWPQHDLHVSGTAGTADARLGQAIQRINSWRFDADPLITRIESLQSEFKELELITEWLQELQQSQIDFSLVGKQRGIIAERLFMVPEKIPMTHYPHSLLVKEVMHGDKLYLYALGPQRQLDQLKSNLQPFKSKTVSLPTWMQGNSNDTLSAVRNRSDKITTELEKHTASLHALCDSWNMCEALGDLMQLQWFIGNVGDQAVSQNFAWLSGWTSDIDGRKLEDAMQSAGIKGLVSYPPPPVERERPLVMDNPVWAKPFEVFASLLGTPGANEADPAKLLALIAPLIFGYMFGDVGHGLLLAAAGWYFHKRWPALGVLFACGISAMIFGFVFGSVFGNEHLLTPLWTNPVEQPLPVLMVPLAGGALLLLLGMLMNSIEAWWAGQFRNWLLCEAPIVLMYLSIIALFFNSSALLVLVLALGWYLLGNFFVSQEERLKNMLLSLGALLEVMFQLVVNTVSFIRVGAFALAHAGLSLAFVTMADSIDSVFFKVFVLILGNAIVILLEGLVVSIQTTRLVLFEFFIRFLRAEGRTLRPLKAPDHEFLKRRKE